MQQPRQVPCSTVALVFVFEFFAGSVFFVFFVLFSPILVHIILPIILPLLIIRLVLVLEALLALDLRDDWHRVQRAWITM